jgi:hypothetical protein
MTTLLDTVQEDTALTYRNGEWHGLCPLHQEKTASFSVNDERGLFHCFGCGAGGDLVSYLVEKRGLSMREALTRAGKILPTQDNALLREDRRRARRKQETHEAVVARFQAWWRHRVQMIADLREEIEVAEIAYRATWRDPHLWTEEEVNYWCTRLGNLYLNLDILLHENLTYAADEQAAWEAWRTSLIQEGAGA